ncbi:MAG TPA: tetratricopeptide repeat protein [Ktedonobacteraceae bacterium]|nr:tetratricopeptide repeat protein [Ktedonobacteraceae bacterium]
MKTSKDTQMNDLLRQARIERNWRQHELAEQLGTTTVTVKRWERGYQQPGPYFRVKLCTLFGKSAEELGLDDGDLSAPMTKGDVSGSESASISPEKPGALWMVPYVRNPHFTGRADLLEQLTQELSLEQSGDARSTRRAVLSQPQVVKGLGGVGKTQIAVEYAYRAREQDRYFHTIWINAASEEAILTSFQTLAERLPNFAERDEKDQHKLIAAVLRWIEQCPQSWLLIVDNADDLSLIQPSLPQQGQGSIVLTTRAAAVGWLANPIEVEQMGLIEGTQFLLHRTHRLSASDEECNEASNVVIALDGFPLALDQAGAYIEETGCGFDDYLQIYEQHRAALLARRGKQATNYPHSVATTWSLSFEKVEQAHPAAAELLRLCAYLFPDHIPEELLTQGAAYWPAILRDGVTDPLRFNELLEALLAFSLVKRLAREHLLSLHRLVQAVQLDLMDLEMQQRWAERVVRAVNTLFPADPEEQVDSWSQCLRYLEQAQACDQLIQRYHLQFPDAAELLDRAGIYLREHASYSLAEPLFLRALSIAEQQWGLQHLQVATSLNNLGVLYREQGQYSQAEPLLQRALHIREQALGPHHPRLVYNLNSLGLLYYEQGQYSQAEPLLQRALRIQEQASDTHSSWFATSLNHLGNLYKEQGQPSQAEPLLQRALHIREQILDQHHPDIASSCNNLGLLYYEQGQYSQAEPLLQRALHIWEQVLGPHHPDVANSLNNLGLLYYEQGQPSQAEPPLQRALHIREQALGPYHPDVASSCSNLGLLYYEQGQYSQAESLLQRALHIWEQTPDTHLSWLASCLNNLGILYKDQGQLSRAEPLLQRALHIREQALGLHHPRLVPCLNNLGELALEQGNYEQAEPFYRRALQILDQAPGSHPPHIAHLLNGLGNLTREQGHYEQAEALYQRALALRQKHLDPQHLAIAETLHDLALLRERQQQLAEALSLYRQALSIREQALGSHHPKTTETCQRLCAVLQALGRTEEAAALEAPYMRPSYPGSSC